MKRFSTDDLGKNLGDVKATAAVEPVGITEHREDRFVLMSIEAHRALVSRAGTAGFAEERAACEPRPLAAPAPPPIDARRAEAMGRYSALRDARDDKRPALATRGAVLVRQVRDER